MVAETIKNNIRAINMIKGFTQSQGAEDELNALIEQNEMLLEYVQKLERFHETTMDLIQ